MLDTQEVQSIARFDSDGLVGRFDYALVEYQDLRYLAYACVPPNAQAVPITSGNGHEDSIIMAIEKAEGCKLRDRILLEVRTCLGYPRMLAPGNAQIIELHIDWFPAWRNMPEYGKTYRRTPVIGSERLNALFADHIAGNIEAVLAHQPWNIRPGTQLMVPPRQQLDNMACVINALISHRQDVIAHSQEQPLLRNA